MVELEPNYVSVDFGKSVTQPDSYILAQLYSKMLDTKQHEITEFRDLMQLI